LVLLGSSPVLGLWESRHDTAVEAQLSPFFTPSVSVVPRAAGDQTVFHRARFSCVRMQSI
jgi:hypothetical protein